MAYIPTIQTPQRPLTPDEQAQFNNRIVEELRNLALILSSNVNLSNIYVATTSGGAVTQHLSVSNGIIQA